MKRKIITDVKIMETRENGGRIRINTGAVDRDNDRVMPLGARLDNYLSNPVVQWGHNYYDPWATIGRTNSIEQTEDYIDVDFDLREPANDSDPVKVIRMLWNDRYVKTASIGFMPIGDPVRNDYGGWDFNEWELLEWSLVPVPANQDALRLAVKALELETKDLDPETVTPAPVFETDENPDETESKKQEKATQSDFNDENDQDTDKIAKNAEIDDQDAQDGAQVDNQDENADDSDDQAPNDDQPSNDESDDQKIAAFFKQLNEILRSYDNE